MSGAQHKKEAQTAMHTEKTEGGACITDRILDATLEIIAREKISGTRMHLIAAEAGTSQSNLHYHFPTKKDLLLALLDRLQHYFSQKRTASVDLTKKSFSENLRAIFDEKKDDILRHPKIDYVQFDYWVQGTVDPAFGAQLRRSFDVWRTDIAKVLRQSGQPPAECEARSAVVPYLMVSLMMGASMQYLIDKGRFDLDAYFNAAGKIVTAYCGISDQAWDTQSPAAAGKAVNMNSR